MNQSFLSVLSGFVRLIRGGANGKDLILPFKENTKEEVGKVIDQEVLEGKVLVDEYMEPFPEGKKPYGERIMLTASYCNNIQFDYLDHERSKAIISGLRTHDGYDVYYPEYYMLGVYSDIERDVYFVRAHLNDRELKKSRIEELRNRYREVYQFVRNIDEFVLLIQGRQAHVFADVSYYQDGVSVHLLEICTKNFEPEEMSQLRIITEKAMDFVYNGKGVPEYSYMDARARMTCERDNL